MRSLNTKSKSYVNIDPDTWVRLFGRIYAESSTTVHDILCIANTEDNKDSILNAVITSSEILDAIKHLKTRKSPGLDEISGEMLECGAHVIWLMYIDYSTLFSTVDIFQSCGRVLLLFPYIKRCT